MNEKQTYLKLVCGETSDINVHYIDTKEVNGVLVSSVMVDPTLRNDLDRLTNDYNSKKDELTNCIFDLNERLEREIDRSVSYDECLNKAPRVLRQCLNQEIEDRSRADSLIKSDIGNLSELTTDYKNNLVGAIDELNKDIDDLENTLMNYRVNTHYCTEEGHTDEVIAKTLDLGDGYKIFIKQDGDYKIITPLVTDPEVLSLE